MMTMTGKAHGRGNAMRGMVRLMELARGEVHMLESESEIELQRGGKAIARAVRRSQRSWAMFCDL